MTFGDIIVIAFVIAVPAAVWIISKVLRKRKKGKGCSCCTNCSSCCGCKPHNC